MEPGEQWGTQLIHLHTETQTLFDCNSIYSTTVHLYHFLIVSILKFLPTHHDHINNLSYIVGQAASMCLCLATYTPALVRVVRYHLASNMNTSARAGCTRRNQHGLQIGSTGQSLTMSQAAKVRIVRTYT